MAVIFLLVGCSKSTPDAPRSAPASHSTATTATASPTATAAQLTLPEAATHGDLAGQEAFVRYFIAVWNDAQVTGDTTRLEAISDMQSPFVLELLDKLREPFEKGGRRTGSEVHVSSLEPQPVGADGAADAIIYITEDAGTETFGDGTTKEMAARTVPKRGIVVVTWESDRWHFFGLAH